MSEFTKKGLDLLLFVSRIVLGTLEVDSPMYSMLKKKINDVDSGWFQGMIDGMSTEPSEVPKADAPSAPTADPEPSEEEVEKRARMFAAIYDIDCLWTAYSVNARISWKHIARETFRLEHEAIEKWKAEYLNLRGKALLKVAQERDEAIARVEKAEQVIVDIADLIEEAGISRDSLLDVVDMVKALISDANSQSKRLETAIDAAVANAKEAEEQAEKLDYTAMEGYGDCDNCVSVDVNGRDEPCDLCVHPDPNDPERTEDNWHPKVDEPTTPITAITSERDSLKEELERRKSEYLKFMSELHIILGFCSDKPIERNIVDGVKNIVQLFTNERDRLYEEHDKYKAEQVIVEKLRIREQELLELLERSKVEHLNFVSELHRILGFDAGEPRPVESGIVEMVSELCAASELLEKECDSWHRKSKTRFDLDRFQEAVGEWADKNFDNISWIHPLMGVAEELGELNHALLKQDQGIRGTHEEHEEAAIDAVGDLIVYLAHLCFRRGWSLREAIEKTWAKVIQRDWKADPERGVVGTLSNAQKNRA